MDIPISIFLLICLIFIVIGAVVMLLLQYYLFLRFSNLPEESDEQKHINAKYSLPLGIKQTAKKFNEPYSSSSSSLASALKSTTITANNAAATTTSSSLSMPNAVSAETSDLSALISLNFVMQFLFHELKNSNRVRKWFYRKLSLELDELIAKTTTGRLFDKLTIKELELGDQFPEMKAMRVHNVELNNGEGRIENLDLLLDIRYAGNFRTTIDADMVLGKKGSLTLKVKQLSGMARLQFTRKPYTHWSLSFLGDPELDLAVESKYQGRQMQSNITNLISNQIRKAVRRKHTLPNYKIRYKPFFNKTPEEDMGDSDIQPNGHLDVKVAELSRLICLPNVTDIYCTLTIASLPFVEIRQKDDRNVIVSLDVKIHKAKNQQIGLIFKQNEDQYVEIEAVLPNTPAFKSNLRTGDIVLAIDEKRISTIQQVAKVVKGLQNPVFILRIERVIPGIIRNDAILEDLELYEDLGDIRVNYPIAAVAAAGTGSGTATLKPGLVDGSELGVKQFLARHGSCERGTSSESSLSNTPTSSPKKTKLIAKAIKKTITRDTGGGDNKDDQSSDNKPKTAFTRFVNLRTSEEKATPMPAITTLSSSSSATTITSVAMSRMSHEAGSGVGGSSSASGSGSGSGIYDVEHYQQHATIDCALSSLIHMDDLSNFKLNAQCRYLNVCVYGKAHGESLLLGFLNISINQILTECCETSLSQCLKVFDLHPPIPQDIKTYQLSNQSGFNPDYCFGDIHFAFTWHGNPNIVASDTPPKVKLRNAKAKTSGTNPTMSMNDQDDSISVDSSNSLKSAIIDSTNFLPVSNQTRSHNFIRTHFQRATQCDFCGKKIWLKDAVQCRECNMCCHKKCVTKCQNATVCGPVDCSTALQQNLVTTPLATPEFTVTEAESFETMEAEEAFPTLVTAAGDSTDEDLKQKIPTTPTGLDVHRSSLTGLLAQGIKRVNSANNLAIPGIVSSLTGVACGGTGVSVSGSSGASGEMGIMNTKSLPPSPQHTPSRKHSLVMKLQNPFDVVTENLEALSSDLTELSSEQIGDLTEPILNINKSEDIMTLAKTASRNLYADAVPKERVKKINVLLTKLRLALDSETATHSALISSTLPSATSSTATVTASSSSSTVAAAAAVAAAPSSLSLDIGKKLQSKISPNVARTEERVQALSVIMLYLCTGLQHAQGMAFE